MPNNMINIALYQGT